MSFTPSVVSDSYIYEPAPRAPDGPGNYRTQWQSEAESYQLGEIIRIPLSQVERGFVNVQESFLNLTIKDVALTGTGFAADNTRMSYIGGNAALDQCNLIAGGSYVQHTTQYQSIFALNFVNNTDINNSLGNSITNNTADPEKSKTAQMVGNSFPLTLTGTTGAAQSSDVTMSIPLMGLLSGQKAIPLGLLTSETVIEIYLTNDIKNILFNNASGGTITSGSCTFKASFDALIEVVSPSAMTDIKEASSGNNVIVSWSSTEQRASSNTITFDQLNSVQLSEAQFLCTGVKPRKLLSLVAGCFVANSQGDTDPWSVVTPWDLSQSGLQWQIGTSLYPARKIANRAEMIKHVSAAYNQETYSTQANRFNDSTFVNRIGPVALDTFRSCCGIDLTSFDKESDGVDCSMVNIMIGGNLKTTGTAQTKNYQLVTVKRFGVLYSIDQSGTWSLSY
jgi:hypothetical protein